MKRKMFLITISLLFFVAALFGQTSSVPSDAKAAPDFSALKTNDHLFDHKTGFYAGALDKLHLNKSATLQPQPAYPVQRAPYASVTKAKQNNHDVAILGQNGLGNGPLLQTGSQLGFMRTAGKKSVGEKVSIKDTLKYIDLSRPFGPDYFSSQGHGVDAPNRSGLRH
jgi:hypothetical protein